MGLGAMRLRCLGLHGPRPGDADEDVRAAATRPRARPQVRGLVWRTSQALLAFSFGSRPW